MASVQELFTWISSRRRLSQIAICSSVMVRDRRRRGEVAPAGSITKWGSSCGILMLVRGGCSGESCSGVIRNSAEKGISWWANCQVLLRRYSKYAEHLRKPVFLLRRYSIHTENHAVVSLCLAHFPISLAWQATVYRKTFELTLNKSAKVPLRLLSVFYFLQSKIEYRRSKNCSAGNPLPIVNPGLKCTRTDAILKKFDWKMNFKLKINLKQDLMNFVYI
jgi:hypothetical protein